MVEAEHQTKGPVATVMLLLLGLFLLLPLLYWLSLGPVMMIYYGSSDVPPWIDWFYQPLFNLINASEWLTSLTKWYLSFWVDG